MNSIDSVLGMLFASTLQLSQNVFFSSRMLARERSFYPFIVCLTFVSYFRHGFLYDFHSLCVNWYTHFKKRRKTTTTIETNGFKKARIGRIRICVTNTVRCCDDKIVCVYKNEILRVFACDSAIFGEKTNV